MDIDFDDYAYQELIEEFLGFEDKIEFLQQFP
jgi:hypothetical protein